MCGPVLPLCLLLWILRATQVFPTGVAAVVQTQQTVSAALGKDATLSCQLLETKVVSQVTWQKVSGNTEKNICTYSEKFGSSVYPEYKDKIQFTEAGSQKSSIVIRNVTEQDAGCYRCLFTTFPDGNLIGRTCLKAYVSVSPIYSASYHRGVGWLSVAAAVAAWNFLLSCVE
ncbi:OX-2 membrane glycoprotein-like isoform X3 [Poecilia latipinna]|uniref:OX-2 membrane glycoprotein-like isoform X3 n=1 Tax=Poecilia mexicana TaxID=48701 RepID=UPI00072E069F|nr:PREDICTED: OX-2 membrane glycoprotein-like isoform X3 [Poecilia mexicana]XP_014906054.1 PREDICTED: OX-2 membrane glycoprotein-like isoform X3 [Poecilia latipinna]